MADRIMIICGSPRRKGNTNRIVRRVVETAEKEGAEVQLVDAARLEYKSNGCRACMSCQRTDAGACIIGDEAGALIAQMPEKNIIIFASPVYWFGLSAQLKLFMDRMFSLIKETPDGPRPKFDISWKLGLIATGGGGIEDGLDLVDLTVRKCAAAIHAPCESLLLPNAPADPEEIDKNTELMESADRFIRKLLATA